MHHWKQIKRFNERVATLGTQAFGSIWTFWAFFAWGLLGMLPWLSSDVKNLVLLISSAWIQLWALPLLAVGSSVLNRASEKRAKEDHTILHDEIKLLREEMAVLQEIRQLLETITNPSK